MIINGISFVKLNDILRKIEIASGGVKHVCLTSRDQLIKQQIRFRGFMVRKRSVMKNEDLELTPRDLTGDGGVSAFYFVEANSEIAILNKEFIVPLSDSTASLEVCKIVI